MMVPQEPNFVGSFSIPSHTGPWDYVQNIPLVLYGPQRIAAAGPIKGPASITDVFPTVGKLLGVDLPQRAGSELDDALRGDASGVPRLVVVVVWDGVGRNVLERWPDAWPTLARLERDGTSYLDATIGSSPSITPAIHSSLGTGAFPRTHEITNIQYRDSAGELTTTFKGIDPSQLKRTTFADLIDRALGNASRVGMVGSREWQLGMLGHGLAAPGGDADEVAIIEEGGVVAGNPAYYSTVSALYDPAALQTYADQLDRSDGEADGLWMGHEILDVGAKPSNPAWVKYVSHVLFGLLESGGYGQDATPDIMLVNYKMADVAGHVFTMDSKEVRLILEAQDAELERLVDRLDSTVGDYVLMVTADHGHTPAPETTGAWPISLDELTADVHRAFDVPSNVELINRSNPVGLYLNLDVARDLGVAPAEIAHYLEGYTISENGPDKLPSGYDDRGDERVFAAVFSKRRFGDVMACAFGGRRPTGS